MTPRDDYPSDYDLQDGGRIVQDGGFNKFTWMLLAGFGSIMVLISVAALSKLSTLSDRVADQSGDIRVILLSQTHQSQGVSSLTTKVDAIDNRLRAIETKQTEQRYAR